MLLAEGNRYIGEMRDFRGERGTLSWVERIGSTTYRLFETNVLFDS